MPGLLPARRLEQQCRGAASPARGVRYGAQLLFVDVRGLLLRVGLEAATHRDPQTGALHHNVSPKVEARLRKFAVVMMLDQAVTQIWCHRGTVSV